MEPTLLGASATVGCWLAQCAIVVVRDQRRIAKRRAIFGGAR
jgi:hypothetical protein